MVLISHETKSDKRIKNERDKKIIRLLKYPFNDEIKANQLKKFIPGSGCTLKEK